MPPAQPLLRNRLPPRSPRKPRPRKRLVQAELLLGELTLECLAQAEMVENPVRWVLQVQVAALIPVEPLVLVVPQAELVENPVRWGLQEETVAVLIPVEPLVLVVPPVRVAVPQVA